MTGYLRDARKAEDFVDCMAALSRDGAMRARMGKAARARALEFSWDTVLEGLLASYRQVLAEHAARMG